MPPSASKAPSAAGSAEVRYSATKHSRAVGMDQTKSSSQLLQSHLPQQQQQRHQQRHQHQQQQQQRVSSFSLGCIFDNPVAFEDSSLCRRKIDYTTSSMPSDARIDLLECQIKSSRAWNSPKRAPSPAPEKLASTAPRQRQRHRHQQQQQQDYSRIIKIQDQRCCRAATTTTTNRLDRVRSSKQHEEEMSYDPARPVPVQTCRRKLCLGDDPMTTPMVSATTQTSGINTPLLDDCEVFSDVSEEDEDEEQREHGLDPGGAAVLRAATRSGSSRLDQQQISVSTPVRDVLQSEACSPVSDDGTASLRSLNALDNSIETGIELEDIGTDTSRRESFRSWRGCVAAAARGDGGGPFFVYPGWSVWSREHSYRSLTVQDQSPISKNPSCAPSVNNFPGVKSLRSSLRQHLAAAASGLAAPGPVNRSSSTKAVLGSRSGSASSEIWKSRTAAASKKFEEGRVPLLKSQQRSVRRHFSPRKRWEPVLSFRKGVKALASKGFGRDGFGFGCGFDQKQLLRPKRLLSERRKDDPKSLESANALTGYLQCILRHGLTSYSFWMDELDEVLVARPEQGDRREKRISFYTCKAREKSGWRHWQKIRKRVVNFIGTMSVSCCVYTEVGIRGEVMHFMDSEFSLFDEVGSGERRNQSSKSRVASYVKALLGAPWQVDDDYYYSTGMKPRKELAAMVIRVLLEVKKPSSLTDKLSRPPPPPPPPESWSCIAGTKGESFHVILPTGDHGHPAYGLDGPRPLAERWRSGGICDCGSWDLGCGMVTLSKEKNSGGGGGGANSTSLNLVVEGTKNNSATMSLSPCRDDGLYRLSFQKPLMGLQAFASAVAILHSKINTGELRYGSETKLPVTLIARRSGSLRSPNPPLSPIDRL